jgi:hypothetical protein
LFDGFWLGLPSDPEKGDRTFLRILMDYIALKIVLLVSDM